jgi:hypothetical protein
MSGSPDGSLPTGYLLAKVQPAQTHHERGEFGRRTKKRRDLDSEVVPGDKGSKATGVRSLKD